jgi:hypothetical protein
VTVHTTGVRARYCASTAACLGIGSLWGCVASLGRRETGARQSRVCSNGWMDANAMGMGGMETKDCRRLGTVPAGARSTVMVGGKARASSQPPERTTHPLSSSSPIRVPPALLHLGRIQVCPQSRRNNSSSGNSEHQPSTCSGARRSLRQTEYSPKPRSSSRRQARLAARAPLTNRTLGTSLRLSDSACAA